MKINVDTQTKKDIGIILIFSFFAFIFGNWILSITSPDEGKNLDAALNMLEKKNFVVPFYNCEYRFEKPPLFYWFTDFFFVLFGVNEFSARIVSGLSATGLAILTYLFGLKIFDRQKALISAIVFTLFIHNWMEARAAVPEMLLTFFMTLGLYLFFVKRFTLGWIALGFAFLAKGPVGVALPSAIYFLWNVLNKNYKEALKIFNFKGIVLFLVISLPWYLLLIREFGYEYFYKFFLYENIYRFTGSKKIHSYPFWYYLPVLIGATVLFLPVYIKVIKNYTKKLNFLLFWFLFVILFYSVAKNKLHHYILFSYPAFALIIGYYVSKRYIKIATAIASILLVLLFIGAYIYEQKRFVPKAVEILKKNDDKPVYFYRKELSAVVFYTRKCIKKVDRKNQIPDGAFVIFRKKNKLENVKILTYGEEPTGKFYLGIYEKED